MNHLEQHADESETVAIIRHPGDSFSPTISRPYNEYETSASAQSGSLFEYWHLLRRHAKTIALCSLLGAILGVLIALPITPVYKVNTTLELLNVNQDFMNMKSSTPVTTNDGSFETSEEQTQVELLQSDSLLKAVYEKLDPDYKTLGDKAVVTGTDWRKMLHLDPKARPLTQRERTLGKIVDSLKITNTPRTRVLQIAVKSTDPQLAVQYCDALVAIFIQKNVEARWQATQKVGDWLGRELEGIRTNLRRSEDALQAYARTSGLIFTDEDTSVATQKLLQIQQQVSAATADRVARQSSFELAQKSPVDNLPEVLNDDNLRKAQAKISDLRGQVAELSARFTPEYGKVKSAQAQLDALETNYNQERTAVVDRVRNEFDQSKRREKLLANAYDVQFGAVTGEGEKAVQYNILKRDVDSNRQLYDLMLQQMKQSSVAAALRSSNVRVVDAATAPNTPYWPSFRITGALGFLLGLLSSIAAVFLMERADRTLQQPGDAQLWTNLTELGTIPSAVATQKSEVYGEFKRTNQFLISDKSQRDKVGRLKAEPIELITAREQPTVVAEAFRSLLTSVLFIGENGSRPRVLVLTSAGPSEGKTTVVTNLAIAMAEIGRRVLIIDADLRRPRMHNLFSLANERGLSDLLKSKAVSDENITELVCETSIPGLSVLPSGPPTNAAANLLYSPNLSRVLEVFRKEYDMVLVDTPPMLQMTDARVVGRIADAVILVARAERTTRDAIMAAGKRFAEDRVRVLGTVLNCWDPKRSSTGYYGQSRYYAPYHYGRNNRAAIEE